MVGQTKGLGYTKQGQEDKDRHRDRDKGTGTRDRDCGRWTEREILTHSTVRCYSTVGTIAKHPADLHFFLPKYIA